MVVLVTCKNEEYPIKNEGTGVLTSLYVDFSDAQGQLTPESVVESRRNSNSSLLLWLSLLPSRMKIQSKIKALECLRHFSHYKYIEMFFRRSRAAYSVICGRIGLKFKLVGDFMVSLTARVTKTQSKMKTLLC